MKLVIGFVMSAFMSLIILRSDAIAQAPEKRPGLAYRGWVYDGMNYRELFAPEQSPALYIIADQPVALSLHRTLIYYWPPMRRYLADWEGLNEGLTGQLEIIQNGQVKMALNPESYSLVQSQTSPSNAPTLLTKGGEADRQYALYQEAMDKYWKNNERYSNELAQYEKQLQEATSEITKGNKNVVMPEVPVEPRLPAIFVTKPEQAFIISLAEGHYSMQLRGNDGQLVADSRRELVVFRHRREGLSYTIIPASKWTFPERSDGEGDTIYLASSQTAYFQPRVTREYIESYYRRLLDPQDTLGRDDRWLWVQMGMSSDGRLELWTAEQPLQNIAERPYLVMQVPGASLGYEILEFDAGLMPDEKPTFRAYKLELGNQRPMTSILFKDASGHPMESSRRTIRLVTGGQGWRLYLPALIPLLPAIALTWRRRMMRLRN